MCSPLDLLSCPAAQVLGIPDPVTDVATNLANRTLTGLLAGLTNELHTAIKYLAVVLAGWILQPSTSVCPDSTATWMTTCATGASPAAQVRGWMLPITALVAVLGLLWQGITMIITRKGEPLLTVLKGLFSVALWGVVGVAGTQLALRAGDSYSFWILQQAIFGTSASPTADVGTAIASMSVGESSMAVVVLLLLEVPFMLATLMQILLMIFREGAVVVLAGQLQLAAAGGFTRLTSGWLAKVTGWMLALIAYKPVAASVYAVAFALMGDGVRNLIMGVAVMIMGLIAMPALMKLFNWSVGAIGNGNTNSLGMLGTSLAAGMHGASAVRGLGGHDANEHARWLDTHGPGGGSGGGPTGSGPTGSGPAGSGVSGVGASAPAAGPTGAGSGLGSTSAAGAAGGAAAGAATGGATLAADAALQMAQKAKDQVYRAADAAGDAMGGK